MRDWHQPVGEQLEIAHREHQERMRLLYPDIFDFENVHDRDDGAQWGYDEDSDENLSTADTEESRVDFDAMCTNDETIDPCNCCDCDYIADRISIDLSDFNEESDIDDE